MKMKRLDCPKHERQEPKQIEIVFLVSGAVRHQVKCPVCGKCGPRRKTVHGAEMAWNEHVRRME